MTRQEIIKHYKDYFDLHAKWIELNEADHLILNWAESLINDFLEGRTFGYKVTDKMKEARNVVDNYIKEKGFRPSYRTVAKLLGIKSTAAYQRLRGYRHMMVNKTK